MCPSETATARRQRLRGADSTRTVATSLPLAVRRELTLLVALFVALRVMNCFWLAPRYSEARSFFFPFAYLQTSGYYPFLDYWLEYPPVLAYLVVGLRSLSLWLCGSGPVPPFYSAVAWQSACFVRVVQLSSVAWETAGLALICVLARMLRGPRAAVRAGWVYLALFGTGLVSSGYLDSFPVFLLLAGLVLIAYSRPVWSAIALAAGFMTKIIPLALLPVAFKADGRWRWRLFAVGTFVVFVGYFAAPFLATGGTWLRCSPESSLRRPAWQTVWALLEGQHEFGYVGPHRKDQNPAFFKKYRVQESTRRLLLEVPPGVYSPAGRYVTDPAKYGEANENLLRASPQHRAVFYRVASRFATDLGFIESAPRLWWVYPLAGLVFATFYVVAFSLLPAEVPPRRRLTFAAFTIFLFFLYAKGWSPQFVAYLIPFLLIVFPTVEGAIWALLLSATAFLEMPLWATHTHVLASWVDPVTHTHTYPTMVFLDSVVLHAAILGRTAILLLVVIRLFPRLYRD